MADWDPSVNEIFVRAIEAGSLSERAAVLDRSCGDDVELRRKVEALLLAHDGAGSFLELPSPGLVSVRSVTSGEGATLPLPDSGRSSALIDEKTERFGPNSIPSDNSVSRPLTEGPGTRIGSYKLLQQIGEGGMGVVYMAEQETPVRRKVALKIIKPGMDTGQVVGRFEAERQALALMDHPNIARVFDAGATGTGRPFFVMELVNGVPITEYCDEARLTPHERLELFVPVCRAIQHAHQKGVIHRDVKPSNVLVTLVDGRPVPKVIDFGVAKATGQTLTERSLFTQFGAIVGTLEYMSPEQAELSSQDVDTRSDVFSLGVLLYELLTGSTPLERARLHEAGYAEILRRIREEEPPRPSTRLSDSGEALPSIATRRHTEPAKLTRLVRGELDWIVMKALEKDRSRRYESASGFASDVERYLADEAVEACPPSRRYRMRKFARKNRGALATAAAFAAVLIVAALVAGYLAVRAKTAEALANRRRFDFEQANQATSRALAATEVALGESERAREQAEALSKFLVATFRRVDPEQNGRDLKVIELLDGAVARLDGQFAGSPAIRGALLSALGETYVSLSIADRAVEVSSRAYDTLKATLGPDDPETLRCRNTLARAYLSAGRKAEAIHLAEETLRLRTARLGPDHPDTIRSRSTLGLAYWEAGRADEAIAMLEQSLKLSTARFGPDHPDTTDYRNDLAGAYVATGRVAEGTAMHEELFNRNAAGLAPDHPDRIAERNNLAVAYLMAGRKAEAISLQEEALKLATKRLGPDHAGTIKNRNNLGKAYFSAGRMAEAMATLEEGLRQSTAKFGPDDAATIDDRSLLVVAYHSAGRATDAIPLQEEALKLATKRLGPDHATTIKERNNLGRIYFAAGRMGDAIAVLEEGLRLSTAKIGPDHPDTLGTRAFLGEAYCQSGRMADGIAMLEETVRLCTAKFGPDALGTLSTRNNLAVAYRNTGRTAEAIAMHEETLRRGTAKLGPDHPETLTTQENLALAHEDQGEVARAEPLLRDLLAKRRMKLGGRDLAIVRLLSKLGANLVKQQKYVEAEPILRECLKIREAKLPGDWSTFESRSVLGGSLLGQKKYAEAEPLVCSGYEGMKAREAKLRPLERPRLAEAAARVVRLYEAWGKPEKAEEWRRKTGASGPAAEPTRR
jgi:eukaryotic-like serine/threonine-protein kinase